MWIPLIRFFYSLFSDFFFLYSSFLNTFSGNWGVKNSPTGIQILPLIFCCCIFFLNPYFLFANKGWSPFCLDLHDTAGQFLNWHCAANDTSHCLNVTEHIICPNKRSRRLVAFVTKMSKRLCVSEIIWLFAGSTCLDCTTWEVRILNAFLRKRERH